MNQFLRFCAVGAVGFVIDAGILQLFSLREQPWTAGRETLHVLWFKAECFFGNQLWRISKDLCLKKNISRWKVR